MAIDPTIESDVLAVYLRALHDADDAVARAEALAARLAEEVNAARARRDTAARALDDLRASLRSQPALGEGD